jgi:hypothetical protein
MKALRKSKSFVDAYEVVANRVQQLTKTEG